jgi:hypothetical protein
MAKQRGKLNGKPNAGAGICEQPARTGQRTQPSSEAIAALAFELWQARGCPEGSADTDWFQAERNLKVETKARAASPGTM